MSEWWETAVGRSQTLRRTFSDGDVAAYGALANDTCPAGEVPEPLVASLFSRLLGVHLPGPGTNYLKQALRPVATARTGEELAATVTVVRVVPDKRLVYLVTTCRGTDGRTVAEGEAMVLAGGIPAP
ncbi:MAG: hotdog family protein [Georgenia sp.]